jgi:hypothetical protein
LERDIATFAYLMLSAKGTPKIPEAIAAAQQLVLTSPNVGSQYVTPVWGNWEKLSRGAKDRLNQQDQLCRRLVGQGK